MLSPSCSGSGSDSYEHAFENACCSSETKHTLCNGMTITLSKRQVEQLLSLYVVRICSAEWSAQERKTYRMIKRTRLWSFFSFSFYFEELNWLAPHSVSRTQQAHLLMPLASLDKSIVITHTTCARPQLQWYTIQMVSLNSPQSFAHFDNISVCDFSNYFHVIIIIVECTPIGMAIPRHLAQPHAFV